MGLIAVFMMVWFLTALGLWALAVRVMGPVRYSRRLWRDVTVLLAFLVGFFLARVLYHAYDRWHLAPLWEERHGVGTNLQPRVSLSWGVGLGHITGACS